MTNQQLYLLVALPMIWNTLLTTILVGFTWAHFDKRIDDLGEKIRGEIHRVEEVMDARLKHLEDSK
jgi:hypothetical protein